MGLLALLPVGRWPLWAGCAICAASLLFAGHQTLRLADARTAVAMAAKALAVEQRDRATERARSEAAAREQSERFRTVEQGWHDAQDENALMARKARDLATQDATAADSASRRLRDRAAPLAAACRGTARDPAAIAASAAASAPGDVLADVLGRLDEAGRFLARYADAARISAEQCAADYQALKNAPRRGQIAPQGAQTGEVAQP